MAIIKKCSKNKYDKWEPSGHQQWEKENHVGQQEVNLMIHMYVYDLYVN